jgi:hypothetical protein
MKFLVVAFSPALAFVLRCGALGLRPGPEPRLLTYSSGHEVRCSPWYWQACLRLAPDLVKPATVGRALSADWVAIVRACASIRRLGLFTLQVPRTCVWKVAPCCQA